MHRFILIIPFIFFCSPVYACLDIFINTTDLDFGVYDQLDPAPTESSFDITVECTPIPLTPSDLPFALGISSLAGTIGSHQMNYLTYQLNFDIYSDASKSNLWPGIPSTAVGGVFLASTGQQTQTFTGYGVIPAGQTVAVGSYSTTIIATVLF